MERPQKGLGLQMQLKEYLELQQTIEIQWLKNYTNAINKHKNHPILLEEYYKGRIDQLKLELYAIHTHLNAIRKEEKENQIRKTANGRLPNVTLN